MAGGPTALVEVAQAILAEAIDALEWGTERAYVVNGPPAFDCCPQLTVSTVGLGPLTSPLGGATPMGAGHAAAFQDTVTLAITVLGCVPTAKLSEAGGAIPPAADAITAASSNLMILGWALWNWLRSRRTEGAWPLDHCRFVSLLSMAPLMEQGGCGGWVAQIQLQLDGYKATP